MNVGERGLRVPRIGLGTGLHGEVSEAQSVATDEGRIVDRGAHVALVD